MLCFDPSKTSIPIVHSYEPLKGKKRNNVNSFDWNKTKKNTTNHLHNDVIDGDVDEFDKEANESHDGKADGGGESDFLKLYRKCIFKEFLVKD